MLINDQLIKGYLKGIESQHHWLFDAIVAGKHTFEEPDEAIKNEVRNLYDIIVKEIEDFKPYNEAIFGALFPDYKAILSNMNVLLAVGCPNPYDAMVREHDGAECIIFDLIRLLDYKNLGYDVVKIIRGLITHESVHACLHQRYPKPKDESYSETLKYIVFDEGFAHILSYKDDLYQHDFSKEVEKYYKVSSDKLTKALKESNQERQKQLLEDADSGSYWDKFGAIAGKLYLAKHIDDLVDFYHGGVEPMIQSMKVY